MYSQLMLILLIKYLKVRAISFGDVCDSVDIHCLRQNINGLGSIKFGKCYTENVLRRIEDTTLLNCVKECFKTSHCTSINFRSGWKVCDINGGAPLESELVKERGCLFSYLSGWPKSIGGICYGHDCVEGQKCTGRNSDGTYMCGESYCKEKPCVPNAKLVEKFGLYRNTGHGVKYECQERYKLTGRPFAVCETSGNWNIMLACSPIALSQNGSSPADCSEFTGNPSGIYMIYPASGLQLNVNCDMDTDGGGWTVFQQRLDGSIDFYREWLEYENGFGCLDHEFWLGNKYLSILTAAGSYELRVDMMDTSGEKRYAEYDTFTINNADQKYSISVSGYSGNAGDGLNLHSGKQFSTKDQDNDDSSSINCAEIFKGAWWYGSCHHSNLNGLYLNGSHTEYATGVNWREWKGYHYSLMRTKMMIRRKT